MDEQINDRRWPLTIGRVGRWGLVLLALTLIVTTIALAGASNPGFLDQSTDNVSAGSKTYRFWYTVDCGGDGDCECDALLDTDTSDPPDGTPDEDSPNDCVGTVDSDSDDIFDTGPDDDSDGILNVVDPNWFGGGTGVVESVPRNVRRTIIRYVSDWGLKEPHWDRDTNRNIYIYDLSYLGLAYPNGSGEELDTEWMLTQAPEPRGTVLHELWHNTQYAYGISAGNWLMEGQARMLQDKVYDDMDHLWGSRYHGSVYTFLRNPTYVVREDRDDDGEDEFAQAAGLLGASYNASLWWTYIADQAGTQFAGTAGEGMDALIDVLEQADDHGRQGINATNRVLQDRIGQGFDDTFWDFTVANYAKDFDLSELDHSYLGGRDPERVLLYSDEKRDEPNRMWYGDVKRLTLTGAELFSGASGSVDAVSSEISSTTAMSPYGAQYYEAMLNPDCTLAYWRVIGEEGARFIHSWMVLQNDTNGDGLEEVVSLLRSGGSDFARAAWNIRDPMGAQEYSRMVGIVATTDKAYGYDWEMACTQPSVNIVAPSTANPAYVGDPTDPGRFLLWAEVTGGMGTSTYVAGLEWSRDFTVTVGGDAANILNGGYVQDQYWLVVQAPEKPGASIGDTFDVQLQLGPTAGIVDTETDAVIYDLRTSDQILVIDGSGSMGDFNKLVSAKAAARLFADVKQQYDQLGVVSFSNDATEVFSLTVVPDQDDAAGVREDAQNAIDTIVDDARTSIGDGLQMGQDMLLDKGNPDHQWVMVLLSDGMENEPLYWSNVRAGIVASGTKVMAIALGQDADEELMRDIAESTCGPVWQDQCYQYIEESGTMAAAGANTANATLATDQTNGLADIYRRAEEVIAGHQRLWQDGGTLSGGGSDIISVEIPGDGVRDAFFSFNWSDLGGPLNVSISGPGGVSFIRLSDGKNHVVLFVDKMPAGTYDLTLSAPSGDSVWIGSLSGRLVQGTELQAFIDNTRYERWPGLPIHLQASLTDDGGPVAGATISVTVQRPDGKVEHLQMADDGRLHDDLADDGVYGYTYDRINRPLDMKIELGHTWIFDLHATGENNAGHTFHRYKRLTYTPYLGPEQFTLDLDGDEMLDRWEDRFENVDSSVIDGDKDNDEDSLTNKEEFELGTNPDDADTDDGGEMDGSEVANGRDPLWPSDDAVPPIADFWVQNMPESVILHFDPRPEYQRMRVYQRIGTGGTFSLTAEVTLPPMTTTLRTAQRMAPASAPEYDPSKGQVLVESLVNDQDYFFYLQPVVASNVVGAPSPVRYAEPAKDPYQPENVVLINDDDRVTRSKSVTLTLQGLKLPDGTRDVYALQVSNTPDLTGVPWVPFKSKMAWTLDPDPDTGSAFVFVRFRDGAGNVSDVIYSDGILYKPPILLPAGLLDFGRLIADFRPFSDLFIIYTPLNFSDLGLGGGSGMSRTQISLLRAAGSGQSLYYGGLSFDLEARDAMSNPVTSFDPPYTLTISYDDWMWRSGGIGSESSLNLYWESSTGWEPVLPCEGCSHDQENNVIVARLNHLTKFALLGEPAAPIYLPLVLRDG